MPYQERCYCWRNGNVKCAVCVKREKNKTTKEGDIRVALKKRVEAYGGEIRAVAWLGRSNAPDVLALLPERTTGDPFKAVLFDRTTYPQHHPASHPFIETKRPGKDATEAQAREHKRMREAGCTVRVITTIKELDAWLPPL